jgi:hypothetical protein
VNGIVLNRAAASPRALARAAGVLYALEGMASLSGQMMIPRLLTVPGDPAATAAVIAANGMILFRLSLALGLLAVVFHTTQTGLLYPLFRPAGRSTARHFAFFSVVMLSLQAGSCLLQLPAMTALDQARSTGAANAAALQSLVLVFMGARARAFNVYLAFFGIRCGLVGGLILRSTFMPRAIGALMVLAGLGYLVYLWPPVASRVHPFNLVLAAPGELSLMACLLLAGVNAERWREQAAASETGARVATGGVVDRA